MGYGRDIEIVLRHLPVHRANLLTIQVGLALGTKTTSQDLGWRAHAPHVPEELNAYKECEKDSMSQRIETRSKTRVSNASDKENSQVLTGL